MRVLITGATGLIGKALTLRLLRAGCEVTAWARSAKRARDLLGADVTVASPDNGDGALLRVVEAADAVVNLAGEPIMGGRLTEARRERLRDSRVHGTELLCEAIAAAQTRPKVLVSASAVGFYGDRGDEPLDESSAGGSGFLAELCAEWERAALRAESLGVRVACLRIGVVLGQGGGMVAQLAPMVRWGLGAWPGSGRQLVPWIHLDDLVDLVETALHDVRYLGALNAVAPAPACMSDLVRGVARALGGRAFLSVPAPLVRLALGEAAEVILSSQNTRAARLSGLGFVWKHPTLAEAVGEIEAVLTCPAP